MKRSLLILCILALIVLVCGCTIATKNNMQSTPIIMPNATIHASPSGYVNATIVTPSHISRISDYDQAPNNGLTSDSYVFIEHHKTIYETMIGGNVSNSSYPISTHMDPMGNPYEFNESARTLWYFSDFGNNSSTIAILGGINSSSGLANGDVYQLYNIVKTPVEDGDIQVLMIYDNGSALLRYNNEFIALKPGDEWTNVTSYITFDAQGTIPIFQNGSFGTNNEMVKINMTTIDSIRNYGILKKSDIIGGMGIIT